MASYGTKGRTINSWSSALVFITSRIPVKGTHTAKYCTYGFQLVQRHCGICRSINQEKQWWWQTAVSIYNPKNNKHIFPLKTQQGSAQHGLHLGSSKTWGTTGVGGMEHKWEWNNVLYYARESRWNTKHWRRLHPSLTDAFIRRRHDVQSNELVISICDAGLKVWWICIPLFLNVHMLCWKGQWKDFFLLRYNTLTIGTTHITAISCCYYRDTKSFIFWGLPDHFHS